MNKFDQEQL